MSTLSPHRLWWSVLLQWAGSAALMLLGGRLLVDHIVTVRDIRASALPLAQEIPALERRVKVLKQQQELSELSHALRIGSPEERVHVFALPEETDLDKVVTAFDVLSMELSKRKLMTAVSPITFEEIGSWENGIQSQAVTFTLTAHRDGIAALETFVRLSGLLSVADALTPDERSRLLLQTELENPAAIVALEQFLNVDLLRYIREPLPIDQQLLQSFSSQSFERTFRDVLRTSLLADAGRILTPLLTEKIAGARLWPMQMMDIETISLEAGGAAEWYKVRVMLRVYTRS